MQTTVLIENAAVLLAIGVALHRTQKVILLMCLVVVVAHMAVDNYLLFAFNPLSSIENNTSYYWLTSLFFLGSFGVFMYRQTKLSIIMAGCMITQAILSFAVAINGAMVGGVQLPDVDFIYSAHELFNKGIWIVECIIVYAATTTSDE